MAETARLLELPMETPIQSPDETREALRRHLKATGKSQSKIAQSIGFSQATLTGFMKGSYPGNMDEVAARISDYLLRETQRQSAPREPGFAQTSFAAHVLELLSYTHMANDMGMIHGDAGVGKTTAILQYVKEHKNVIFITAGVDLSTPKAVVEDILEQLNRKEYGGLNRLTKLAIQVLRGSGRLIIIDEANHLNARAKEVIRKIHDQAGVGVVYCGSHDLYSQMHGRKGIIYAQLLSRIGIRRGLERKELTVEDIRLIFEQNEALSEDCIRMLHEEAQGEGGLRYVKKMYLLGSTLAYGTGESLSIYYLSQAQQMLMRR